MGQVIFTNALGDSIQLLNRASDYVLNLIDGIGDVEADIQTQASPNLDGEQITNIRMGMREISIGFTVFGKNPAELSANRSYAGRVLNPKLGAGTLVYKIDDSTIYSIECIPRTIPQFPSGRGQRAPTFQRADVTMLAPDPFWRDEVERTISLYAFMEGFSFPLEFPMEFGEQGASQTIYNEGHEPAPFVIEVRGPNTYPRITNFTTGQFIEFNRTINLNERLIVSTERGKKYARIVSDSGKVTNAMPFMTSASELFSLQIGPNEISYNAVSGTGASVATLTWKQLYNSI